MMQIELTGDWTGVNARLNSLAPEIRNAADWGMRKAANRLVDIVKGHIDRQDLGWRPRAESTNSGDPRVLVDTGQYYRSIKAWRKSYVWYAGVPAGEINSRGLPVGTIALFHEYGTSDMPARPLWGPSLRELGAQQGVRDIVMGILLTKVTALRDGLD